jgi:hypothetical protein
MLNAIASGPRDVSSPTACSVRTARSACSGGRRAQQCATLDRSFPWERANAELASSAQRSDSACRLKCAAHRGASRRVKLSGGCTVQALFRRSAAQRLPLVRHQRAHGISVVHTLHPSDDGGATASPGCAAAATRRAP